MTIGPFVLWTPLLILLCGIAAALATNGFLIKRGGRDASPWLYVALGGGLLLARVAYVVGWWPHYRQHPLSVLNIRDGGFDLIAGLIGLILATLWVSWRRPALRRPLLTAAAVGVVVWAFAGLTVYKLTATRHPPLPALTLTNLEGHDVAVQGLRGQPTVINLWATWCGPCRREMPVLAEAQRDHAQIRFVFADQGESAAAVQQFLQQEQLLLDNVLIDGNLELSNYYRVRGYPTTLFIDADGQLRDTHMGELSRATLAEALQRISPPAPDAP